MVKAKTDEQQAAEKKRRNLIAIASAIVVAATPGAYTAWQAAKEAAKAKLVIKGEQRVRDRQEADLQKWVKANAEAIAEIKRSMVTHKDLLDLALRLREVSRVRATRPGRPAPPPVAAMSAAVGKLKEKARAEDKARQKAAQALEKRPKLKPAQQTRQLLKAPGF